jgi:hypothetical protein
MPEDDETFRVIHMWTFSCKIREKELIKGGNENGEFRNGSSQGNDP